MSSRPTRRGVASVRTPLTFEAWLSRQARSATPVGALARDVQRDHRMCGEAYRVTASSVAKRIGVWEAQVQRPLTAARQDLAAARRAYRSYLARVLAR